MCLRLRRRAEMVYKGYRITKNRIGWRAHTKGHTLQGRNGADLETLKKEIDWHKQKEG